MATFPTLGVLQTALTRSVVGLTAESSHLVLQNIRQIPGFSGLSDLNGLVSQDCLARMLVNPARFHQISRTFTPFHDLPALRETMAIPSLDARLGTCAQALDLRHGVEIYWMAATQKEPGRFTEGALSMLGRTMSRVLKDELAWPRQISADSLGSFAISVRRVFDARSDHLTAEQRHHLMQIAVCLDTAASTVCAFNAAEALTPSHAKKIANLIEVLFGCGFGTDHWLTVSDLFRRMARNWERTDPNSRNDVLRRMGEQALQMVEQVLASYLALLDKETPPSFTGALPQLSNHLAFLTA